MREEEEHPDWSWLALNSIMQSAVNLPLSVETVAAVVNRAEKITLDFGKSRVEQVTVSVALMEIREGVIIHKPTSECERCGQDTPVSELRPLSADGYDQLVCQSCDEAYERFQQRKAGGDA